MFKKTIEFEDFNGEKTSQDFYFHISQVEAAAMAHGADAFQKRIKRIEAAKDGLAILEEFRAIVKLSCGVRSEDGKRFIKTPEAQSELLDSPAFDVLVMEMCTDAEKMTAFVNQLFPEKMQKEMIEKYGNKGPFAETDNRTHSNELTDNRPAYQKEDRKPTKEEQLAMSKEELAAAMEWYMNKNRSQ